MKDFYHLERFINQNGPGRRVIIGYQSGFSIRSPSPYYRTIKEKTPQEINAHSIDFGNRTVTKASIFNPGLLGLLDISDVQELSTGPAWLGSSVANHLLILSQESSRLLEVDRNGSVLSTFDLSSFSSSAEGVTIDTNGTLYIVDENGTRPRLFVLTAVPIPPAFLLFGTGLMTLTGIGRRKTR